jgi:uncharacterized protein YkwD
MGLTALIGLCATVYGAAGLELPASAPLAAAIAGVAGPFHPAEMEFSPALFTQPQRDALDAANHYRSQMGLPPMRLHPALCDAAQAHNHYLSLNGRFTHEQEASSRGFTGRMPWDRARAAGYPFGCAEDITSHSAPAAAVEHLMAAPYHRVPFMEPAPVALGVGSGAAGTVLEFDGKPGAEGVVVYPADGQKGVPTNWDGLENPSPLRFHSPRGSVGYVVSYQVYLPEGSGLVVKSAKLMAADGTDIACFRNTPSVDEHLKNGVLLIPQKPLKAGTIYRANVEAATDDGKDLSKSWSFTTEPAQVVSAPVRKSVSASAGTMRLTVRSRPGGMGALLTFNIQNRGKRRAGPFYLSVVLPQNFEARALIPAISAGKRIEMRASVKSATGQVRLLTVPKKGVKLAAIGFTSFDVRSASARR